jgi:hypothetical protein
MGKLLKKQHSADELADLRSRYHEARRGERETGTERNKT